MLRCPRGPFGQGLLLIVIAATAAGRGPCRMSPGRQECNEQQHHTEGDIWAVAAAAAVKVSWSSGSAGAAAAAAAPAGSHCPLLPLQTPSPSSSSDAASEPVPGSSGRSAMSHGARASADPASEQASGTGSLGGKGTGSLHGKLGWSLFLFKRRKFKGSSIKSRIAVEGDYFGGGGGKPRAGGPAAAPAHCRMPSLVTGSPLPALALVRAFARCQSCRPFWRSPCNQPFRQGCRGRPVLTTLLQVKVQGAPKANALFLLPALVPLYQI